MTDAAYLHLLDRIDEDDLLPEPVSYRIEPLCVDVEWMRYCTLCDGEQRFVADRVCVSGLIGYCSRCGDERIVPFTRTHLEAT